MTRFDGRIGFAISPHASGFAPLLFAGRLEEGLAAAAELGFAAVELSLRSAGDIDSGQLRSALDSHRLSLSAIATGQAYLVDSLCLASPDADVRARAAGRLAEAIELAAEFGARVIVGGIRGRLIGTPAEQSGQRAGAVEVLGECARRAAQLGVGLLLEPINRYETNFVNTAAEGLALLGEVGEPTMKLLLDTFHMNIEEKSLAGTVRAVGDRVGYVHIADSNRRAPGQGHVDFGAVLEALEEIDYGGMLVAEILPLPDDRTAALLTSEFWKSAAQVGGLVGDRTGGRG
jgi:sugar phosphate isomerase/epimerase